MIEIPTQERRKRKQCPFYSPISYIPYSTILYSVLQAQSHSFRRQEVLFFSSSDRIPFFPSVRHRPVWRAVQRLKILQPARSFLSHERVQTRSSTFSRSHLAANFAQPARVRVPVFSFASNPARRHLFNTLSILVGDPRENATRDRCALIDPCGTDSR